MSTNKTQNYQLHSWEPKDDFLRSEFNENFRKLDENLAKKTQIVMGAYIGNYATNPVQTIELGFKPMAVLVEPQSGIRSNEPNGGFAMQGRSAGTAVQLTETGFTVRTGSGPNTNATNKPYIYMAIVAES